MSPQTVVLVQTIVSAVLVGLVYSLISVGLTLIFGVVDIVNFAHGEFLMIAMYLSFWMYTLLGFDPMAALPFVVLVMFGMGVVTYRLVVRHVLDAPMLAQIFVTFGLLIFLRMRWTTGIANQDPIREARVHVVPQQAPQEVGSIDRGNTQRKHRNLTSRRER